MEPDDALEIEPSLPAVIVGYRAEGAAGALRCLDDVPPWLVWWKHQYGGYACDHVQLAGALAPLAHAPGAHEHRNEVLEGLFALGCDGPRQPEIRRFPVLEALHLTRGEPYRSIDVDTLQTFLSRGFELPPIERGFEAFVELVPCELERSFHGWPVVAHEIPSRSHLADPDAHQLVIGPRGVRAHRTFDERLLASIVAFGASVGIDEPPRAFLVWFNSD